MTGLLLWGERTCRSLLQKLRTRGNSKRLHKHAYTFNANTSMCVHTYCRAALLSLHTHRNYHERRRVWRRWACARRWWKLSIKLQLSLPVSRCHSIPIQADNCFSPSVPHSFFLSLSFPSVSHALFLCFPLFPSLSSDYISELGIFSLSVKQKTGPSCVTELGFSAFPFLMEKVHW